MQTRRNPPKPPAANGRSDRIEAVGATTAGDQHQFADIAGVVTTPIQPMTLCLMLATVEQALHAP